MPANDRYDFTKEDIEKSLQKVGLVKGDSIFIHSNIGFFGKLKDAATPQEYYRLFKSAILNVLGPDGTIVVPVFTYSFCNKQIYDKKMTMSVCGFLSESFRKDPQSIRSDDANFSVSAIGKRATEFTSDAPEHSFGPGSFWAKFFEAGGKICNFNFDSGSTLIHFCEKTLKVPYRFDKAFPGVSIIDGQECSRTFYHFVHDLKKPSHASDFVKFDTKAKELSFAKCADLGKGQVLQISARDTFDLIKEQLKVDPAFLVKGSI